MWLMRRMLTALHAWQDMHGIAAPSNRVELPRTQITDESAKVPLRGLERPERTRIQNPFPFLAACLRLYAILAPRPSRYTGSRMQSLFVIPVPSCSGRYAVAAPVLLRRTSKCRIATAAVQSGSDGSQNLAWIISNYYTKKKQRVIDPVTKELGASTLAEPLPFQSADTKLQLAVRILADEHSLPEEEVRFPHASLFYSADL